MIKIIPLSHETLNDAIVLIESIFPYRPDQKNARYNLTDSLVKLKTGKTYWIAVNEDNKVVGITGLYDDYRDRTVVWLGWYGVHPEYRKQGIGSMLLQFAIDEAKRRGFSLLKLYTSSDKNERDSHSLYRKFGFTQFYINKKLDKIYFEKYL